MILMKSFKKDFKKSGKVACQVCKIPEILVEHHIRGRKIPNYNHKFNLCYICGNCHNKIHSGKIIIEDWAMTDKGLELLWHFDDNESFTGNDAIPHIFA